MKNILIITPYYPYPDTKKLKQDTRAVYYLTKEKSADENIVFLYYYQNTKMDVLKKMPSVLNTNNYQETLYKDDRGNDVLLFEHLNLIPQKIETIKCFDNKYLKILEEYLEKNNIEIDTLVVHFPTLFSKFANKIKAKNKIAIVHSFDIKNQEKLTDFKDYDQYDKFGFRSLEIKEKFRINTNNTFLCLSGVPDSYINECEITKPWKSNSRLNIVFVGRLDKNKNVSQIINALACIRKKIPFKLTIIGEGIKKDNLIREVRNNNLTENVLFLGRLDRDKVHDYMRKSDLFVMTSIKETLGITYLEAISGGNLVIGSKNQGISGLFNELEGCFFVDPLNIKELAALIMKINTFSYEEVVELRENSYKKIKNLTESKTSHHYIQQIIEV